MDKKKREGREAVQEDHNGLCLCTCTCCGHQNPEGSRHCQACGHYLIVWEEILCPSCGAEIPAEFSYCGHCGSKRPKGTD